MSKVNLYWLEIPSDVDFDKWADWLGSSPRFAGEVVEGMTVPKDKVWLFPIGSNFQRMPTELLSVGVKKQAKVEV